LFAGRLEFQKGCDLLPDIIRQTKLRPGKRIKLCIYGEGSQRALLEQFWHSPPEGWDVKIFPPKPNLVEALPDFDILLFPSRFEGYGRLAAEAVLVGIPVVAFGLPALLEVFPPEYPWIATLDDKAVSNFAEKLSSLIASFEEAQQAIDLARSSLKDRLARDNTASAYVKLYESKLKRDNTNR
jgi:glycosyltransferase involved in cell wall biosynthesis